MPCSSHKERKTVGTGELLYFMVDVMGSGQSLRGMLDKALWSDKPVFIFGVKEALSLRYREGEFHMRVLEPALGEPEFSLSVLIAFVTLVLLLFSQMLNCQIWG
jgi:hypothetical protein